MALTRLVSESIKKWVWTFAPVNPNEQLNGEIFDSLSEAQILIEEWRKRH